VNLVFLRSYRALSEVLGATIPYDDVVSLRDRMWDLSPTLVRYENIERPSVDVSLLGLGQLSEALKGSKATTGEKLSLPVKNFYQTDVISRR